MIDATLTKPDWKSIKEKARSDVWSKTHIVRAIRAKCLDCSGGNRAEVERCTVTGCALYPYRLGRRGKKMLESGPPIEP